MTKSRNATLELSMLLDEVGGEPLAGSGFEEEQPERGYAERELGVDEKGSSHARDTRPMARRR
jgi:hypothetical protein